MVIGCVGAIITVSLAQNKGQEAFGGGRQGHQQGYNNNNNSSR